MTDLHREPANQRLTFDDVQALAGMSDSALREILDLHILWKPDATSEAMQVYNARKAFAQQVLDQRYAKLDALPNVVQSPDY